MPNFPHSELEEYKTQAALLLKQLRSDNAQQALAAATRFLQLSHLQNTPAAEIVKSEQIKLKHALNVIAVEHHFESWADFKKHLERKEQFRARMKNPYTLLYPERCAWFMNGWHASYELATEELKEHGGYLLPYKNQYIICGREYIDVLGLDPDDPDWTKIGWNWAQPADRDAWERLNHKLIQVSAQK